MSWRQKRMKNNPQRHSVDEHEAKRDRGGWDTLICDAEAQIVSAKREIADLRKSVRFFTKRRARGTPFPLFKKDS